MRLDPGRHKGFFEMHIEQGTQLEQCRPAHRRGHRHRRDLAVPPAVQGKQDHAGGTTMAERRDAGLTAVRLLAAIDAEFPRVAGERSTWTTGRITLDPGAPSIIPGNADVLFQFRDVSMPVLERMEEALRALVREANRRERCTVTLEAVSKAIPALCDPAMMAALDGGGGAARPGQWQRMPSGAGHDAQDIARLMPAVDAVRALDRRHQPSLGGGHQGRGPGPRRPGAGRSGAPLPGRLSGSEGWYWF